MNRDEKMEEALERHSVQLPDGRKIYNKYQIRHTDGTPLKGKQYFVLRLDSDDPKEAARVSAAMTAYKGEAVGNAAAMREALGKIRAELHNNTIIVRKLKYELFCLADAALSSPPRNCDVGTAEEQRARFVRFCEDGQHTDKGCCGGCPIVVSGMREKVGVSCEIAWAQLPYESEAASIKSVQSVHSQTAKCAGCGRGIDVRYDEYVEIGPARYCPKCYVRRTESEAKE